jgi:tetratricopeptide (TPR) repeat protein
VRNRLFPEFDQSGLQQTSASSEIKRPAMKNHLASTIIVCIIGSFLLFGCETLQQSNGSVPPKDQPGPGIIHLPDPDESFKDAMERGRRLEQRRQYQDALMAYERALTLARTEAEKREAGVHISRLKTFIDQRSNYFYEQGMKLEKERKFQEAKDAFREVLKLKPEHQAAGRRLHWLNKMAVHTVKPGDTCSQLAQNYYGTFKKCQTMETVVSFNDLDCNSLVVGDTIYFPVITKERFSNFSCKTPCLEAMEWIPNQMKEKEIDVAFNHCDEPKRTPTIPIPSTAPRTKPKPDPEPDPKPASKPEPPPAPEPPRQPTPLETARRLCQNGQFSEGLDILKGLTEDDPENSEASALFYECALGLGLKRCHEKRWDQAIEQLQFYSQRFPGHETATECLCIGYYQKAMGAYRNKDHQSAEEFIEQAKGYETAGGQCQSKKNALLEKHYNDGMALIGRGMIDEAVKVWEIVILIDPDYRDIQTLMDPQSFMEEGIARFNSGDYMEAMSWFGEVRRMLPDNLEAYRYQFQCHFNVWRQLYTGGHKDDAKLYLHKFKEMLPNCPTCREMVETFLENAYQKGRELFGNEAVKESEEHFRMVSEIDPDYKRTADFIERLEQLKAIH